MATPTSDRQRQFFVLFLLAMIPAGNALNPCLDVDTWWHLRVGQYIVNERILPEHDPFSQIGREEKVPWIAYSWLYELMLYGSFQAGGFAGVLVFRNLLDLLTFCTVAWFLFRQARNPWAGLGALALVTVALTPFTPERPWHFTIVFTTLTLHAVQRIRDGAPAWRFAWLPLLYVLWANIHIQFVMGFAVLGLAWIVTFVESRRAGDGQTKAAARRLFWLGAACAVATLATPFHVRLYVVIWEYATQTTALRLVSELQPPILTRWYNLPLVALLLAASACVAVRGYRLWDLVLLASAVFFSLRMQRDLWYGVLAAGLIVVRGVGRNAETGESPKAPAAWQVGATAVVALLLMRAVWEFGLAQGKTVETCHRESFPVSAIEYVKRERPPGPLFNHFDWGGYLIWELPDYPVSMDGRTNLYGEARLERSMNTWSGGPGWEDDPELMRAGVIIAPKKGFPLAELMRAKTDRWVVRHEDDTAVVFVPVRGR